MHFHLACFINSNEWIFYQPSQSIALTLNTALQNQYYLMKVFNRCTRVRYVWFIICSPSILLTYVYLESYIHLVVFFLLLFCFFHVASFFYAYVAFIFECSFFISMQFFYIYVELLIPYFSCLCSFLSSRTCSCILTCHDFFIKTTTFR